MWEDEDYDYQEQEEMYPMTYAEQCWQDRREWVREMLEAGEIDLEQAAEIEAGA